jgi:ParB family chromosome partitioning protein
MNNIRNNLGKGLSALLGEDNENPNKDIKTLPLALIAVNKNQPRKHFDEEAINELAQSIKEQGIIQPLIVRKSPVIPSSYEVIAGERRYRAAKKLGLKDVPVIVKELSDNAAFEIALIENLQRENLNSIEEAKGYARLRDNYKYTQEDIAKKIGKSRAYVTNILRLLNLPEKVVHLLEQNKISKSHAKALVSSDNPEELAEQIITGNLSVRSTENISTASSSDTVKNRRRNSRKQKQEKSAEITSLEKHVTERTGFPTRINMKKNGEGEIKIEFSNTGDLDRIIFKITN